MKNKTDARHREEMTEQASFFQNLANPVRLCILHKLLQEEELCVSDFCECMDASQPLISKHLIHLKENGILRSRAEGTRVLYRLTDSRVRDILALPFDGDETH